MLAARTSNSSMLEHMRYKGNILSVIVFLLQQDGITPLIIAANGDHTGTVKELLSSGATVDLADQVSAWKRMFLSS